MNKALLVLFALTSFASASAFANVTLKVESYNPVTHTANLITPCNKIVHTPLTSDVGAGTLLNYDTATNSFTPTGPVTK